MQVKTLTRADRSLIRGALGTVRRLSDAFLYGERCALHAHRVRCRAVYEQCTTFERPGQLPAGVPPQCNVGDTVTARHPRLRTIHDGDVLTVSTSTYMVQFHRSELGVSKVQDTEVARSLQQPASAGLKGLPGSGAVVSLGAPSAGLEEAASRGEAAPASSTQVCCFAVSCLVFLTETRPHRTVSCSCVCHF